MAKKYKVVDVLADEEFEKTLNEESKDGWEVLQVLDYGQDFGTRLSAKIIFVKWDKTIYNLLSPDMLKN